MGIVWLLWFVEVRCLEGVQCFDLNGYVMLCVSGLFDWGRLGVGVEWF